MSLEERIIDLENTIKQKDALIEELKKLPPASEFELCRQLLYSAEWPMAVEPALLCNENSEEEKQNRAEGIVDFILDRHPEKLSFLDFGCGEGHVCHCVNKMRANVSVGYDIAAQDWNKWSLNDKFNLTTDWEIVKRHAPYDMVLIYDVLDHMQNADVAQELMKIKDLLNKNGKIYVRCHPWCSRHGAHLYQKLNKAFIQLVFSDEELADMNLAGIPVKKIIHPIDEYKQWFDDAKLKIESHNVQKQRVEPFFINTKSVAKRIKNNWKTSKEKDLAEGKKFPAWQTEQQFLDYVLR